MSEQNILSQFSKNKLKSMVMVAESFEFREHLFADLGLAALYFVVYYHSKPNSCFGTTYQPYVICTAPTVEELIPFREAAERYVIRQSNKKEIVHDGRRIE